MPITLRVAAATALLAALLTGLFPGIDRETARLFWDAGMHAFPAAQTDWGQGVRTLGMWLPQLGWAAALLAVFGKLAAPERRMWMRPSIAIFLVVTALAIPALLVNGGFKSHWARPRPVHVVEFGGAKPFKPWWDNSGSCMRNCSFMSGETSSAALLVGVATLAPLTVRPFAMIGAGLFTLLVGIMRVAFGGHWLSDVLLGGSVSVLLILAAHRIVLVSRGIDEAGTERALGEIGWRLRAAGRAALRVAAQRRAAISGLPEIVRTAVIARLVRATHGSMVSPSSQ